MRQLVCISLLLIITFRFACGERKISQTIRNSQNKINMMAGRNCVLIYFLNFFIDVNDLVFTGRLFCILRPRAVKHLSR